MIRIVHFATVLIGFVLRPPCIQAAKNCDEALGKLLHQLARARLDQVEPLYQRTISFDLLALKRRIVFQAEKGEHQTDDIFFFRDGDNLTFQVRHDFRLISAGEIFKDSWTVEEPEGQRAQFYLIYNDGQDQVQIRIFYIHERLPDMFLQRVRTPLPGALALAAERIDDGRHVAGVGEMDGLNHLAIILKNPYRVLKYEIIVEGREGGVDLETDTGGSISLLNEDLVQIIGRTIH